MNPYPKQRYNITLFGIEKKQGRKRPLDTPERKMERRERETVMTKTHSSFIPRKISRTVKKSINNAHSHDANTKKYDSERERENKCYTQNNQEKLSLSILCHKSE